MESRLILKKKCLRNNSWRRLIALNTSNILRKNIHDQHFQNDNLLKDEYLYLFED